MTQALRAALPERQLAAERLASGPAIGLSEARRDWNRERAGLVSELRCECAQPSCKDWLPAVAENHRGLAGRFVVMPTHVNGDVVVRAADRFFVVESGIQ